MLFYDVESFKTYWCVVVYDDHGDRNATEVDRYVFEDVPSLRAFYKANRQQTWVGFNSRAYDMPMVKFIMLGLDAYECSQALIVLDKKPWQFPYEIKVNYNRIPFRNYDCMPNPPKGLKKLEGFMGSSIVETSIPFDYEGPLTREQKDEIIKYCSHDVAETRKFFYLTIQEYEAHEGLVQAFNLHPDNFNKTKSQLAAVILGAVKQDRYDEWEFTTPAFLQLNKYKFVLDWFEDPGNHDYFKKLEKVMIAGAPHDFGWGGVHGAKPKYQGEGFYLNIDVKSYYPSMLIEYNLISRSAQFPEKYAETKEKRLELKAQKHPWEYPLKIFLNGMSGAMKATFNPLYDPRNNNSMCVSGQLLLLDLIEKVEDHCELIQSNTDGILIKLHDEKDYDKIKAIVQAWESRTKMEMEFDEIRRVYQKDVNNYITVDVKGKVKSKGAWAKTWLKKDGTDDYTDYDCVILREALLNYFAYGIPVEKTVMECKDLIKFQQICMVSSKYLYGFHGTVRKETYVDSFGKKKTRVIANDDCKRLNEKYLRVFASKDEKAGGIYKVHAKTNAIAKMQSTPVNAFLYNEKIIGKSTDEFPQLDKQFYIDVVNKRIKDFC
jgi:DNA polymerase